MGSGSGILGEIFKQLKTPARTHLTWLESIVKSP